MGVHDVLMVVWLVDLPCYRPKRLTLLHEAVRTFRLQPISQLARLGKGGSRNRIASRGGILGFARLGLLRKKVANVAG